MDENDASGSNFKPLIGTDEATIDDKGRLLVGKKKRERLGEDFVIALGDIGCLVAYPEHAWEKVIGEINQFSRINHGRQVYTRMVLGTAEDELKFDGQGRVVIPQKLRELSRLREKVVLVGCLDRLEIWDKDEYQRYLDDTEGYGLRRRQAIEKAYNQMVAA